MVCPTNWQSSVAETDACILSISFHCGRPATIRLSKSPATIRPKAYIPLERNHTFLLGQRTFRHFPHANPAAPTFGPFTWPWAYFRPLRWPHPTHRCHALDTLATPERLKALRNPRKPPSSLPRPCSASRNPRTLSRPHLSENSWHQRMELRRGTPAKSVTGPTCGLIPHL